jgi:hypothetical protein
MWSSSKRPPEYIRESNITLQTNTWGFRIYRATYSDQARWDKFITLLKDDAQEFLEDPKDQDLLRGLTWDVVEDEAKLNGKNWDEAIKVHDAWVLSELTKETACGRDKITENYVGRWSSRNIIELRTKSKPHWEFFIFADEESVNSVLDADANNTRGQPGTYFITVVQSGLVCKSEMGFSDDEDEDDAVELEVIPRKAYWQRFRGWLLVDVYASVITGLWPMNYQVREDELSDIWRYE